MRTLVALGGVAVSSVLLYLLGRWTKGTEQRRFEDKFRREHPRGLKAEMHDRTGRVSGPWKGAI